MRFSRLSIICPALTLVFGVLGPAVFDNAPAWAKRDGHHEFKIHGYFRSGLAMSESQTTQADFQAPGAPAKYRLGNEADTNGELLMDYKYHTTDGPGDDTAYLQFVYMADVYSLHGEYEFRPGRRQSYVRLGRALSPGGNFWAGRRYYDRKNIHMNNYYWLNPGQGADFGFGWEGEDLGFRQWKAAVFRYKEEKVTGNGKTGTLKGTAVDLRLLEIATNAQGTLNLWGQWRQRKENGTLGFKRRNGFGLGLWHEQKEVLGGTNTFALIFHQGPAVTQGSFNARSVREDQGYDLRDAYQLELNNNLLIEPQEHFSLQWALIARQQDFGREGQAGDTLYWLSTGVRPVFYFNQYLGLAVELGVDHVHDQIQARRGTLFKSTLALQITRDRGYLTRPVVRPFITTAIWSDDFKGLVGTGPGDAPYGDQTHGWTAGIHFETWW